MAHLFVLVAIAGIIACTAKKNWVAVCWAVNALLWCMMYINRG